MMTAKQRMLAALEGRVPDETAVALHWWGLYKFQFMNKINGYDGADGAWGTPAEELAEIDSAFWQAFKPDMFHLTTAPKLNRDPAKEAAIQAFRKRDDVLESKSAIDEYMALLRCTEEEVAQGGEFRHVELCARQYGDDVLIALNEGSDTAWFFDTFVGFENGLVGMLEEPDNVQYFLSQLYARTLERMKALKKAGAHAFINSETYCSADIMSPSLYREVIFPVQQDFYKKLSALGLLPIVYFTGDILPMLEDIKALEVRGLMVEASKKTFTMDVGQLAPRLERKMALFGNLNSHACLELGSEEDVRREAARQLEATKGYPFILANDCPISFNTPQQNIRALVEAGRNWRPV